jgi:hypothetical protein
MNCGGLITAELSIPIPPRFGYKKRLEFLRLHSLFRARLARSLPRANLAQRFRLRGAITGVKPVIDPRPAKIDIGVLHERIAVERGIYRHLLPPLYVAFNTKSLTVISTIAFFTAAFNSACPHQRTSVDVDREIKRNRSDFRPGVAQ